MTFTVILVYPQKVGVGEHAFIYTVEADNREAAEKAVIKGYKDPLVQQFRGLPEKFIVVDGKPFREHMSIVTVCG
jgi:hypothetical protein